MLRCRRGALLEPEPLEGGSFVCINRCHVRRGWPGLAGVDEFTYLIGRPLDQGLDASVLQIADPAAEAEALRQRGGPVPVTDPLDPPCYAEMLR